MPNKFGLTDEQYQKFSRLHRKHLSAWESEERQQQHSLENIQKVDYNPADGLFYVYYKRTKHFKKTWYHYDTNRGVWW